MASALDGGESGQANEALADRLATGSATLKGHTYEAVSVGGFETCHIFPSLKLCFDIGRCPQRAVAMDNLLLTHTHLDHVGGIFAYVASRAMLGLKPPTIVVPPGTSGRIRAAMDAVSALDGCTFDATLVELSPLSDSGFTLANGLLVRAFFTSHPVTSQGYVVYRRKKRLKEEFRSLTQAEIAARVRQGDEVNTPYDVPLVSFTGDTDIRFLDPLSGAMRSDDVTRESEEEAKKESEVVVEMDSLSAPRAVETLRDALVSDAFLCECTFVDDAVSAADALSFGHMTYRDIASNAAHFSQCGQLVLTHFSARYKAETIRSCLSQSLPPAVWARTVPLLRQFA